MLYDSGAAYRAARHKAVFLFGMSGVGKTGLAALLRHDQPAGWYHYSVDYRLGTRYLGEAISDMVRRAAMQVPLLHDLLRSGSIQIDSKLAFDNLALLSTYLGAPGDPRRGGISFHEYRDRQRRHRAAEMAAMGDTAAFIDRARNVYGYDRFVGDASGSICELADPEDARDALFAAVAKHMLPVYLETTTADREALLARFDRNPKPLYFDPEFLDASWQAHCAGRPEAEIDPSAFLRAAFGPLLERRVPRYEGLARRWAVSLQVGAAESIRDSADFDQLVAEAIDRRAGS